MLGEIVISSNSDQTAPQETAFSSGYVLLRMHLLSNWVFDFLEKKNIGHVYCRKALWLIHSVHINSPALVLVAPVSGRLYSSTVLVKGQTQISEMMENNFQKTSCMQMGLISTLKFLKVF